MRFDVGAGAIHLNVAALRREDQFAARLANGDFAAGRTAHGCPDDAIDKDRSGAVEAFSRSADLAQPDLAAAGVSAHAAADAVAANHAGVGRALDAPIHVVSFHIAARGL